ncbi:MAG TPA: serine/threonine-protein kinase [Gaiellales bacterium]|jgi:serine/threonine protein kinase|nr:serine/threonine-protein kinase [Gaiellales bacterium]
MPTEPMVGTEFAGYRLNAVISRTNMSVVYTAEHPRLGHAVALKVLAPDLATNDRFRERFVSESRMAAGVRHPNVVPIYDAGPFDGLLYIAMLYVAGADLRAILKERGRLSPDQAVLLLGQAGRGLDAAHRQNLVHRDVKPGNILVERGEDQEPDHVYLSDFGITKRALTHTGLTSTGQFVGTVDYVAPEQIAGGHVDGRADIYSLGCVLYECLVGSVPFVKEYEQAIVYSHQYDATPRPSALRPDLPEAIDHVIARATAKNPDDRYPSCRAMMEAAAAAFGLADSRPIRVATVISDLSPPSTPPPYHSTPPPSTPPPSTPPPAATPPPSHPGWQTPPGSTAAPAASAPPPQPSQPAWGQERPWPRQQRAWLTSVLVAAIALILGAALATVAFLATRDNGAVTTVTQTGPGGDATAGGTTGVTGAANGFPASSQALQLVMDPRALGHGQCVDSRSTLPGVPATISTEAIEMVRCHAPAAEFPTVTYEVLLYSDTTTLTRQFSSILRAWKATGKWERSPSACAAGVGKVFAGGPVRWLHPANPPAPPALAGFRACYNAAPAPLMVWTHMRNNGQVQADHYDTLVVATSSNSGTLPTDLRDFWRFVGTLRTPIGKSLDSSPLPPLTA